MSNGLQAKIAAFMTALDAYVFSPCPEDREALQDALSNIVEHLERLTKEESLNVIQRNKRAA